MSAGNKSIQKIMEPENVTIVRKIFCILLALFGAFAIYFGVTSILNATAIVETANSAAVEAGKTVSFSPNTVSIMCGVFVAAGLAKIYLGLDSLSGKRQKIVNIVIILQLVLIVIAFVVIYNVSAAFMAILITDLCLSLIALCWLNVRLARYLREMFGELKKLTWLSGKDLFSHTFAVLVFVLFMAVVIWLLDLAFSGGFSAIARIKIG